MTKHPGILPHRVSATDGPPYGNHMSYFILNPNKMTRNKYF